MLPVVKVLSASCGSLQLNLKEFVDSAIGKRLLEAAIIIGEID